MVTLIQKHWRIISIDFETLALTFIGDIVAKVIKHKTAPGIDQA